MENGSCCDFRENRARETTIRVLGEIGAINRGVGEMAAMVAIPI